MDYDISIELTINIHRNDWTKFRSLSIYFNLLLLKFYYLTPKPKKSNNHHISKTKSILNVYASKNSRLPSRSWKSAHSIAIQNSIKKVQRAGNQIQICKQKRQHFLNFKTLRRWWCRTSFCKLDHKIAKVSPFSFSPFAICLTIMFRTSIWSHFEMRIFTIFVSNQILKLFCSFIFFTFFHLFICHLSWTRITITIKYYILNYVTRF